jgi:hypothetical protein
MQPGLHFVEGRVSSMDNAVPVGREYHAEDYDFIIEADRIHVVGGDVELDLIQPIVTVVGVARLFLLPLPPLADFALPQSKE